MIRVKAFSPCCNVLRTQSVRYLANSGAETNSKSIDNSGNDASSDKGHKVRQTHNAISPESLKGDKRVELAEGKPSATSANYCFELVRKHDFESYLCTLILPNQKVRRNMFAIRAFNTEVALIRDQITQKELGLGRTVFWRDAINQLYLNKQSPQNPYIPKHPVIIELNQVIFDSSVSKKWLTNLLESREKIMTDTPFRNLSELEAYCDQSVTSMLYLALEVSGTKSVDVDHAASHLGKAIGLCNFIRSIPFNAQHRRVLIPQELLIKNKLSQENIIRYNNVEGIQEVSYEIACYAHSHYEKAKSLEKHVSKNILPIFLSGIPSLLYLKRLQKAGFNPFDPSLQRRNGLLPLHLLYKKLTKSYY